LLNPVLFKPFNSLQAELVGEFDFMQDPFPVLFGGGDPQKAGVLVITIPDPD
jgi:hypothetical protein